MGDRQLGRQRAAGAQAEGASRLGRGRRGRQAARLHAKGAEQAAMNRNLCGIAAHWYGKAGTADGVSMASMRILRNGGYAGYR